jgi:hypothetical protein
MAGANVHEVLSLGARSLLGALKLTFVPQLCRAVHDLMLKAIRILAKIGGVAFGPIGSR